MAQEAPLDLDFVYESYFTPFGSWSPLEPLSSGQRGALHHLAGARAADAAEEATDDYSIGRNSPLTGPIPLFPPLVKPVGGARRCARQSRRPRLSPRTSALEPMLSWYALLLAPDDEFMVPGRLKPPPRPPSQRSWLSSHLRP